MTLALRRLTSKSLCGIFVFWVASPQAWAQPDEDFEFADDASQQDQSVLGELMHPKPGALQDPMGPRRGDAVRLSLAQLLPLAAENPRRALAQAKVAQMQALLNTVRYAWIPSLKVQATLSPGANIACDDIPLATKDPNQALTFQYCRARSDAGLDLNRIGDYLKDIKNAGIAVRVQGDLVIPISTLGKGLALKAAGRSAVALAGLDALRVAQQNTLETQQAFLALQLTHDSLRILQEAWTILAGHHKRVQADAKAGPQDLPRVELAQIDVVRRTQELYRLQASARSALWALAGQAAPRYFAIKAKPMQLWALHKPLQPRSSYYELAKANRPEALMAKSALRLRRAQETFAKRQFLPDLGIMVGFRMGYANKADVPNQLYYDNRANFSAIWAGLGVRWEFVPSLRIFGLHRARAQTDAAYAQKDAAMSWVQVEVDRAYDELKSAKATVKLTEMAIARARRLIAAQEAQATIGEADFDKLAKALERWATLEFERLQAISRHNQALARLSRAVGQSLGGPPA